MCLRTFVRPTGPAGRLSRRPWCSVTDLSGQLSTGSWRARMGQRGWAVVTGASAGLGHAFVKELVGAGYPVMAVARRRERLDQLAAEMQEQGGKVEALAADLGSPEGLKSV